MPRFSTFAPSEGPIELIDRRDSLTAKRLTHLRDPQISKQRAFELGQIVATPGALAVLKKAGQQPASSSRATLTASDIPDEDRRENEYSLEHGFRLLSAYKTNAGDRLWIITEADRSVTIMWNLLLQMFFSCPIAGHESRCCL